MRLENETAIVTGGGSGIGAATCRVLANRGADVIVADVDTEAGERVAVEVTADADGDAVFAKTDMRDEDSVQSTVETARDEFGSIDVLVNNAAVASREADGPVTDLTDDGYEFITEINLRGPMYGCKHAIPAMRDTGDGTGAIVNNASVAALVAEPGMDVYTATKGALVSLTRSIAVEYAPEIRANVVCPGVVETPMLESVLEESDDGTEDVSENLRQMIDETPLGMADPNDVATAVAFLASSDAAAITGATIPVDGGFTAQ